MAGLGRKGALEVGFTFHRYGFPILPGSSVKGVTRARALFQIDERLGTSELKHLEELLSADGDPGGNERRRYEAWQAQLPEDAQQLVEDFRAIFGTTAMAGRAIFFDAIPANKPRLELDIMNPHYPKYYSGDEFPTNWQSPVPVYFLTVAPGTEFRFAVGWRRTLDQEGERLRNLAAQWLCAGLQELGAGAKTAAGYGYFSELYDADRSRSTSGSAPQSLGETPTCSPRDSHQSFVDNFKSDLQALPTKDVAGQIARFVNRWRQARLPDEYRVQMAQAILEKVEAVGRTKKSRQKQWFQELQTFLSEHGSGEG